MKLFYSQELDMKQSMDNVCPKCETKFHKWGDYHQHVTTVKCAKTIRPVNTSGRSKEEIVMNANKTWLKAAIVAVGLFLVGPRHAFANCGNDNGNGNGCSGGGDTSVTNITNVTNVTNVTNNSTTNIDKTGIDPRMTETRLGLDTAIRLYDGKRFQWQAYNVYSPSMHDKEDIFGDGRNLQYGVRLVFKLGSSYEERRLNDLEKQIQFLQSQLRRK